MPLESRWSGHLDMNALDRRGLPLRALQRASRVALAFLLFHLFFEYLRLHEILPILGTLKIQTVIFAGLLVIVIIETAKAGVRLARQSWLLLGFLGLAGFTILLAHNQFFAYKFAYGITLTLIGYFAITHVLKNQRDVKIFLCTLVGIHVFIGIKRVLAGPGFGRVGGYILGDGNDLALAMVVVLPFALYLFRQTRSLPARMVWGGGSVAILLSIIFTSSRGGFVGLVMMTVYWIMTSRNKSKAIASLVLAGGLVIAVAPSEYWARIETIKDTDSGTAQIRRDSWTAARRMFYDSPIWGVGGHNFGVRHPEYALEYSEEARGTRWGRVAHSMYFDVLAEFGLLGVFLIGSVLLANFRDIKRVKLLGREGLCSTSISQLNDALQLSWVGFLVPAAFISVLAYPHLYYLTALTVVVSRLALVESELMEVEPIGSVKTAA